MTWCICSACINPLCVASPLAASEAGLLPSARLGSFPDETPWRTLQEHDRPSWNQLPGPQTAAQGLPARLLPVAATQAAFTHHLHPLQGALGGEHPPSLLLFRPPSLSPIRTSHSLPTFFLPVLWMWKTGSLFLFLLFFFTTSSLFSGRSGCPGGVYSSAAASYSVNGRSLPPTHDHWLLQNPSQGSSFQEKNCVIKWHSSDCTCNIRLTVVAPYGAMCVCVFVCACAIIFVCRDNESSWCKQTQENTKKIARQRNSGSTSSTGISALFHLCTKFHRQYK